MLKMRHIIGGTLFALVVVHDIQAHMEVRFATKLYLDAAQTFDETQAASDAQIQYLCHVLHKHGVDIDEFDLIALTYHN